MNRSYAAEPLREVEDWEMRLWCEERGILPRRLTFEEQMMNMPDFSFRRSIAFNRIRLSIDPFTPIEIAVNKIRKLLEKKQAEYLQEIKSIEDEFTPNIANDERLSLDFPRSSANKRVRGGETMFSIWLRSLRVYDRMQNFNEQWREIASTMQCFGEPDSDSARKIIEKDRKRAKKLIEAAWRGIPLAAVKPF